MSRWLATFLKWAFLVFFISGMTASFLAARSFIPKLAPGPAQKPLRGGIWHEEGALR